ncbi:MAG: SUMF1/EgtB/PvdO family nonheme iron enzyme [Cyclobacteriaceae bacterium]
MYRHFLCALLFIPGGLLAQVPKTYDQSLQGSALSFRMVGIPAGKFLMGSPVDERHREEDEGPQKEVQVSAFWMSTHEVTFAEWDQFFKDLSLPQSKQIDGVTRPTPQYIDLTWGMGRDDRQPTNSMSQQAAMMYCKWLYTKTGHFYRLPTEAEWEYACKAGQKSTFSSDPQSLAQVGYFKDNSGGKFHKVEERKPNAWGLFDMLGNVSEWTIDQYDPAYFTKISGTDPLVPPAARYPRTTRGGSYLDGASELRCSNRIPSDAKWNVRDPQIPKSRWWLTDGAGIGFRVIRPVRQPGAEEIEKFYNQYFK